MAAKDKPPVKKTPAAKEREKQKQLRETAAFKRRYFDYYDDVKTSVKEDW